MTKLVWDQVGDRRYETGIERGVLYLPDGTGVPWNGLTGVEEDNGDIETNAYYYDGIKYLDTRYPGDFSATLRAITYPDEFLPFDGFTELNNGVLLGHQPVYDRFSLSYRTRIGNDVDGTAAGYKIHILYNLVASPDNRSYATMSDKSDPTEFSWKISGVPEPIPGYRPTVHLILDTTRLNSYLIADIEALLYGEDAVTVSAPEEIVDGGSPSDPGTGTFDEGLYNTTDGTLIDGGRPSTTPVVTPAQSAGVNAKLPPLADLVNLLNTWVLIDIKDNGDGTWTATGPADYVTMLDANTFQIAGTNAQMTDANTYKISSTHDF